MTYYFILSAGLIIVISHFCSILSKKTNIPSVLMLIVLGIIIKLGMNYFDFADEFDFFPILEILGVVGLIMIVLEAALELELKKEKTWLIVKSFVIAVLGLIASAYVAAIIFQALIPNMNFLQALIYATPLSILSSAIIIPSVENLTPEKKEFHIYESTFSDIAGIIMFYFLTGQLENEAGDGSGVGGFLLGLLATIVIAVVASYAMLFVFQNLTSKIKLFLMISILLILYALGKMLHLSPLIIILIFGLIMSNRHLFIFERIKKYFNEEKIHEIEHNFHIITLETAFVVRTFFFVIFGITIVLSSLKSITVVLISLLVLVSIYLIRFLILALFYKKNIFPQITIAPRGLITVLLFFAIPPSIQNPAFESGILLFIIIASSLIMTFGLIKNSKNQEEKPELKQNLEPNLDTILEYESNKEKPKE